MFYYLTTVFIVLTTMLFTLFTNAVALDITPPKACEHLAIQIANLTQTVCVLKEVEHNQSLPAFATLPPATLLPEHSQHFIIAPHYHTWFYKVASIELTYSCGGREVKFTSLSDGCQLEPRYLIGKIDDQLSVNVVYTLGSVDANSLNHGYAGITWFIQEKSAVDAEASKTK